MSDTATMPVLAEAAHLPARVFSLEFPIIEALWNVVQRPVGGNIEEYDVNGNVIALCVSPDTEIIHRIRTEYAAGVGVAFHEMVAKLAVLVESMGGTPTAGKAYSDHGSAFTTLVYEVLKTAPLELQVHGAQRIHNRDGHWDAINQATHRALRARSSIDPHPTPTDIPAVESRCAAAYGVHWDGPQRQWCVVAYGATPPSSDLN